MRKGAIPIEYIIAIILGIIVVGVLGYWFFVLGGRLPGQATETWCRARENQYCSELSQYGFDENLLKQRHGVKDLNDYWNKLASGCDEIGIPRPTIDKCKALLGLK